MKKTLKRRICVCLIAVICFASMQVYATSIHNMSSDSHAMHNNEFVSVSSTLQNAENGDNNKRDNNNIEKLQLDCCSTDVSSHTCFDSFDCFDSCDNCNACALTVVNNFLPDGFIPGHTPYLLSRFEKTQSDTYRPPRVM
jgi:hypothetical protein